MNASRIGAIVLRMFYLYRGSPQRVFPIFIFVAIDILVWGFLTRYLNSVSHADFNFVPALLGAVLLWDFLTRVMQQITMTLFEDVWTRNFLNFFASPLRTSEYLIGLLIVAIITSGLSLVAMIILAQIAFGLSFLSYGLAIAPFFMVMFLTGIALGVAASALVLRLGPASEWLIWPIPMLISPFAGVFYPVTDLARMDAGGRADPAAGLRVRRHAARLSPDGGLPGIAWRSAARLRSSTLSSLVFSSSPSIAR